MKIKFTHQPIFKNQKSMNNLILDSDFWLHFWRKIAPSGSGINFRDSLIERYSEAHRTYHTTQHINECLNLFKEHQSLAEHPEEVFFAIFYHDAIYEPSAHNNEKSSADLAIQDFKSSKIPPRKIFRIADLILATQHPSRPITIDQQLIIDIDLSILGATGERFMAYEQQIRQEYYFVPEIIFNDKRRAILKSFLDRPAIYNTPQFMEALESQARSNLTSAISQPATTLRCT